MGAMGRLLIYRPVACRALICLDFHESWSVSLKKQNVCVMVNETMVRKNVRDFRGSVINPRDHFVLPDKRRLSLNDVSELLSNQQFWTDNPRMRTLLPQLLEYMVSPYKGAPTVAGKKVRGGGIWDALFKQMDGEMDADDSTNPAPLRHGATARPPKASCVMEPPLVPPKG